MCLRSGSPVPNERWQSPSGPGTCDGYLQQEIIACADGGNVAAGGQYEHYCDLTCGFDCVLDGVEAIILSVLPPGVTEQEGRVAKDDTS